ncbi:MAG: hypothetical protein L0214_09815 [candidate division NC10 bacterium]|nr:hypothetical protein [candidate division NC10 bacterium]
MTGPKGREAGWARLQRAQRALFVELGRRIFRLRPRDPSAALGALAAIGRRAFLAGWTRHHPDLLPLHERLLEIEAALARANPERLEIRGERRGRRESGG